MDPRKCIDCDKSLEHDNTSLVCWACQDAREYDDYWLRDTASEDYNSMSGLDLTNGI